MKKALAILLAFSMLLSLTACGGKTAPASVSSESEQSTDSVEDAAKAESEYKVLLPSFLIAKELSKCPTKTLEEQGLVILSGFFAGIFIRQKSLSLSILRIASS